MGERQIAFHRSEDAETPLSERIERTPELRDLFSLNSTDEVGNLERKCIGTIGSTVYGSLREYVAHYTIAEMRATLNRIGLVDVPRGPKAALVDLYYETFMPETLEDFMSRALPYGPECVRELRLLTEMGGMREAHKRNEAKLLLERLGLIGKVPGIENLKGFEDDKLPVAAFPNILLFDQFFSFIERVPQEALDFYKSFTDEDWRDFERGAAACVDAIRYFVRATDLRGVVSLKEVIDEWRGSVGGEADGLVVSVLEEPTLWCEQANLDYASRDGTTYLICEPLVEVAEREIVLYKRYLLEEYLDMHEEYGPRPVDEGLVEAGSVNIHLLETPEAHELIELLDDHVPESSSDSIFSLVVTIHLIDELRMEDDVIKFIDKELSYEDVRATGDLAARIHAAAIRLNRIVPKWRLNGWTLAEEDAHLGRDFQMPDTEADEEPSGYVPYKEIVRAPLQAAPAPDERAVEKAGQPDSAVEDDVREEKTEDVREKVEKDDTPSEESDSEELAERYEEENKVYLDEFEDWLTESGLKRNTISRHLSNAGFYINDYLAYHEGLSMREGMGEVGMFFGWFYIRKCLWSTPNNIRTTAASLKKFYKCMCEFGHIEKEELRDFLETIKFGLDDWCDECADYNRGLDSAYYDLW
jgi:hypothetical protein